MVVDLKVDNEDKVWEDNDNNNSGDNNNNIIFYAFLHFRLAKQSQNSKVKQSKANTCRTASFVKLP